MIEGAVAFAVTFALGFAARWAGPRVGALDRPEGDLKPHGRPVTYLGGISVAGGIFAGVAAGGNGNTVVMLLRVLLPALAIGLIGDGFRAPPWLRLALQVGVLVALLPPEMRISLPGVGGGVALAGTVVLFVAAMNAVNMVDGMDGLVAGTSAISALGIASVASISGQPWVVPIAVSAAAVAILIHNAPPAGLFLGDNGSYLLGAAMAAGIALAGRSTPALLGAISCLGLFWLDLILSLLRRLVRRVPLTSGDRGHFYDQLMGRGLSVKGTVVCCYALQGAFVYAGVLQSRLSERSAVVSFAVLWGVVVVALFADRFVTHRPATS
ncbi:MAG: hypothetical protein WD276_11120 [Actinomycetota bacterium]